MIDIRLNIPDGKLQQVQDLLRDIPKGAPRVTARALNRTMAGVRTEVGRAIGATYTIRVGEARETMRVENATTDRLQARLTSRGAVLGIQHFQHSPTTVTNPRPKVGVRVKVRKDSGGGQLPGTFIAGGKIGIFRRSGPARLPIERLSGPAVPSMMGEVLDQGLQERAEERLMRELDHEVDYLLTGGAR